MKLSQEFIKGFIENINDMFRGKFYDEFADQDVCMAAAKEFSEAELTFFTIADPKELDPFLIQKKAEDIDLNFIFATMNFALSDKGELALEIERLHRTEFISDEAFEQWKKCCEWFKDNVKP